MTTSQTRWIPSRPLAPGPRYGLLSDFEPGTRTLGAGTVIAPGFALLTSDIVLDKDVAITLRDGTTIYADVFRPIGAEKVPVIVAWSPYGKGQSTSASARGVFALVGLKDSIVSGLQKFEGPDPEYWCQRGYAICHPDERGTGNSEGDSVLWDRQEGRDAYDVIEWLAEQDWCSGKVGMSGTSYLAASQWFTAAEQPPHLSAINPWEGVSDTYRDLAVRGGMPDTGFARQLQENAFLGLGRQEDILTEVADHPLVDELWEEKIPDYDRIEVPAYVVASYSNTLHTPGTFRAWRRIASAEAWLRIHASQEWPDYYDETSREDLRRFFDHYLRGEDNGWETTPPVRYSVLDLQGGDRTGIAAQEFPPAGSELERFYLDARSRTLRGEAPEAAAQAGYDTSSPTDQVSFLLRFDEPTELVGYPSAHLFVEADGADDMDLFVLIQKLDAQGTPLAEFTVPNTSGMLHDATEHGGSILRYRGSDGRLRVSLRHLDPELSTEAVPHHTFDRVEKLAPGQIAEIDVELLPVGLSFAAGEQLRLVVSGHCLTGTWMPGLVPYEPANAGRHVIRTGGEHASFLRLPVMRG